MEDVLSSSLSSDICARMLAAEAGAGRNGWSGPSGWLSWRPSWQPSGPNGHFFQARWFAPDYAG